MSSRERVLAATRREPMDYAPLLIGFEGPIPDGSLGWHNEQDRLSAYDRLGLDKAAPDLSTAA